MTESVLSHPYLGIIVSIAAYGVGVWVKSKSRSPLANPLLIASALVVVLILCSPITLDHYRRGGSIITMLIVPATTVLAIQICRQWTLLRSNIIPVVGGCVVGSLTSIASIWVLCRWFGIENTVTTSVLPKSVTTAIAIELSEKSGGVIPLTVSAVILTGIVSSVLAPLMVRLLRLRNRIGNGIAFGVSGHAIGTAKALEMGEEEGAFSGIALGLAGIVTSVLYAVYSLF